MTRSAILFAATLLAAGLILGPAAVSGEHTCRNVYAIPIASTIYIDIHDYQPTPWAISQDPTGYERMTSNPPPVGSETHIYMESNGKPLLQRSEVPSQFGFTDSYGLSCVGGDTLLL